MPSSALIRIAARLAQLERKADLPTFDEWVQGKKFKNPKTKKDVSFNTLEKADPGAAEKVRKKFNDQVQQWQVQDELEGHGIDRKVFESHATWVDRVKKSNAEVEAYRKSELERVAKSEIGSLLEDGLPKDQAAEVKAAVEKAGVDPSTTVGELDAETAAKLDAELASMGIAPPSTPSAQESRFKDRDKTPEDKEEAKSPGENIEDNLSAFIKMFGNPPDEDRDLLLSIIGEQDKLVKALDKKLEEAKKLEQAGKDLAKLEELETESQALLDQLDESEKLAEAHKTWRKQNAAASRIHEFVRQVRAKAKEKGSAKPEKKPEPKPEPEPEAKPEKEKAKPEKPKKEHEDKKPGEIWGKKPKLYSKNPKGEVGGPFKGMNEAKRWSKGTPHTKKEKDQAEKTRKEQQQAKRRKKRGLEELVTVLATEHVLLRVVAHP